MAVRRRRAVFARVNRRSTGQASLEERTFADDIQVLAESRKVRYEVKSRAGVVEGVWTAADLEITSDGDFLIGVLGYSEHQEHVEFEEEAWSWIKGQVFEADAAANDAIAPFAIDLREGQRWVAFAVTSRMQPNRFRTGLELSLQSAVLELGLLGADWEVDLVTSKWRINEWIEGHPLVYKLRRTIKFSNPGRDLDSDRAEMRALGARRLTEEYAAPPRRTLRTESDEFQDKLDGTETGILDLTIHARAEQGSAEFKFNSNSNVDEASIEDYAGDLHRGMEIVLDALRAYLDARDRPNREDDRLQ